ncbi:MAG: type II toxin-antitoxin system death-on-curing family toxin [Gemmatimonadetes bacterium]|nr:type II toxin-antitoxin system death-on-curing family toxin [Gemmatimonadota bacterium]MYB58378.1 type II toxin-antitoxin system death-on-curing family toxin [Gemmatimonadota bacterium]
MRYISLSEVLELHRRIIEESGGSTGLRDLGGLESAITQPRMTFGGRDLYPTLIEKAAALCFSLVQNHPFIDGNKRVGHAAMEVMLILNGYEIYAPVDDQEQVILELASGDVSRDKLIEWLTDPIDEVR